MKKINGFTLIELIIVLVILSILTAVAVPEYKKYSAEQQYQTETFVQPQQNIKLSTMTVEDSFKEYVSSVFHNSDVSAYCEKSDPDGDMRVLCSTIVNIDGEKQLVKAACLINGDGCTSF